MREKLKDIQKTMKEKIEEICELDEAYCISKSRLKQARSELAFILSHFAGTTLYDCSEGNKLVVQGIRFKPEPKIIVKGAFGKEHEVDPEILATEDMMNER